MNKAFQKVSFPDGTIIETHSQDKRLHSEIGPAWRMVTPHGLTVEMYFRDGKLDRRDGPAISASEENGAGTDMFFVNGFSVPPIK